MNTIDLHVHSNRSDGTFSPASLAEMAAEIGLSAFALTDHDTTAGLEEALRSAAGTGVEVIPGIEFSTEYQGIDIHIVGLDVDYRNPDFQRQITAYQESRTRRNRRMADRMAKDGIDISTEKMMEAYGDVLWTRAHFARYLTEHGYTASMKDAFRTHIGCGCPYYVPREKENPLEVTALIRRFGGIPVLAHPLQYTRRPPHNTGDGGAEGISLSDRKLSEEAFRTLLGELKNAGLIGMEVYYSTHSPEDEQYLLSLAAEFNLLPSGGSDFHGANKPDISLGTGKGNLHIPCRILEDLRAMFLKEREAIRK